MKTTVATHCCVYINCDMKERINRELSFFRFPVSNEIICEKWLKYCGNTDLIAFSKEQLSKRKICELHFIRDFIMSNSNFNRKTLVKHAIPINFVPEPISEPEFHIKHPVKRTYSNSSKIPQEENEPNVDEIHYLTPTKKRPDDSCSPVTLKTNRILVFPSPSTTESSTNLKLRLQLKNQSRIIKAKKVANFRLRTKLHINNNEVKKIMEKKSRDAKTFINMQLKHKSQTQWTETEKQLALSYYYKSPALYKYMRNTSNMTLPSPRTIRHWLSFFHLPTGIETTLFNNLLSKVKVMEPAERECVLIFDEMSIKQFLQLDSVQDLVEGFEDLGNIGRTNKIANHATVFMVRGLMRSWKIPISYYYSHANVIADNLSKLVQENIKKCLDIGLNIRCIVCDQCSNNRATFSKLGVTKQQPFFELNSKKIYAIYDTPHLIKSIRNTLLSSDLFMEGNRVSWNDIRDIYKIDTKSFKSRILLKITDKHISPNTFEKMTVKLATQIFSRTMASALETGILTNDLKSNTAKNTAVFIRKINDIFDCLNSRVLNDSNPYRCGLSDKNLFVKNTLKEAIIFFLNCKLYNKDGKERHNIYCFDGIVQTITAILNLFEDIKKDNYLFLLTNRLQQDALENQFSVIRSRGGYNPNPTARQFRQALQQCMHVRILDTVNTGNCEPDKNDLLCVSVQVQVENDNNLKKCDNDINLNNINTDIKINCENVKHTENIQNINEENVQNIHLSSIEECSFIYFTGYLVHQCLKHYDCKRCEYDLQKNDELLFNKNEMLLVLKDYGKPNEIEYLKRPAESLIIILMELLDIFQNIYEFKKHESSITNQIKQSILNHIGMKHRNWLRESDKCFDHKMFIINKFIKVKLLKSIQWDSRCIITN